MLCLQVYTICVPKFYFQEFPFLTPQKTKKLFFLRSIHFKFFQGLLGAAPCDVGIVLTLNGRCIRVT